MMRNAGRSLNAAKAIGGLLVAVVLGGCAAVAQTAKFDENSVEIHVPHEFSSKQDRRTAANSEAARICGMYERTPKFVSVREVPDEVILVSHQEDTSFPVYDYLDVYLYACVAP